uniref:Ig-like domain-containing protein n=2 Tax=Anopheles atroparvus TaxID=41427 RepID=A0AAG5D493_ANOAO
QGRDIHSLLILVCESFCTLVITDPKFSMPIANVTAAVGRDATLTCVVHDLGAYKVAWLRVDTQTILTIQNHVITKNKRIGITYTEKKTWQLRIKDIRETDRGWYMCQINTDPMKSQMGYLDVVVPPDILDYPTSTDMVVREGSNVTLRCAAVGSPPPAIVWRREAGDNISLQDGEQVSSVEGPTFTIPKVNRLHMGAYLCIASNGVPPTVSKRVMLIVCSAPRCTEGAGTGQRMTLECHSEAYPKSINYWTREKGDIVPQGGKYEPVLIDNAYKVVMKLSIKVVSQADFGAYKCIAKNSLGETDGTIKLYSKLSGYPYFNPVESSADKPGFGRKTLLWSSFKQSFPCVSFVFFYLLPPPSCRENSIPICVFHLAFSIPILVQRPLGKALDWKTPLGRS